MIKKYLITKHNLVGKLDIISVDFTLGVNSIFNIGDGSIINEYGGKYILEIDDSTHLLDNTMKVIAKSIEITDNKYFDKDASELRRMKNIILEGCDFAGKTTLAHKLVQDGFFVRERDIHNFSSYIREYFSLTYINDKISENLAKDSTYIIITLEDSVLVERMKGRENLSEFDKIARISNAIYKNIVLNQPNVHRIHINEINDNAYDLIMKDNILNIGG